MKIKKIEPIKIDPKTDLPASRFWKIEQAAAYLNEPISNVRIYQTRGLPYYKSGKRCLYLQSDLDSYMEKHKITGPTTVSA